jgi:hypothetical protein
VVRRLAAPDAQTTGEKNHGPPDSIVHDCAAQRR